MDIKGIGLEQFAQVIGDQSIKDDAEIVSANGELVPGGAEHQVTASKDQKASTEANRQLFRAVSDALGDTGFKDDLMSSIAAKLGLNADGTEGSGEKLTKRVIREVVNLTKSIKGEALVGESALPESVGKAKPAQTERTAATQATEAVAEPKDAKLSSAQLGDLRDMASLAFGNGSFEGKSGGAGYMALVDGKAVKFLTRSGERSDFKDGKVLLFESDKAALTKATDGLKTKLLAIAATLDDQRQARVKSLLVEEKLCVGKETYEFLSRESVAAALSVFEEAGVGFSWKDVKPVKSEGDMSLEEKIFKHDAAHIEECGKFDSLMIGQDGKVNDSSFIAKGLKTFIGSTFGADALAGCAGKLDKIAKDIVKSLTTPFPENRQITIKKVNGVKEYDYTNVKIVRNAVNLFDSSFAALYKVLDDCKSSMPEDGKNSVQAKIDAFKRRQNEFECEMMEDSEIKFFRKCGLNENAEVISKMRDATYVAHAGDGKEMGLVNCDDLAALEDIPEDPWEDAEFITVASNDTTAVTKYLLDKDQGAKVCTEICADGSDLGCGIGAGWKTQEESVLKKMDPETMAFLLKTKQVEKILYMPPDGGIPQVRYRYTEGADRLSTAGGYLIDGRIGDKTTAMLFSSMPGLGRDYTSRDPRGNTDWMCNCMRLRGINVTPEVRVQVRKFIDKLYALVDADGDLLNPGSADFADIMITLLFGNLDGVCNVLCDEKDLDEEVMRFVDFAELQKHRQNGPDGKSPLQVAKDNYEKTVRLSIRAWILKAKAQGNKYFLGSAIGSGAFNNDASFVGRIFAEEFAAYGGKMKYVYMFYESTGNAELKKKSHAVLNVYQESFQTAGSAKGITVAKPEMVDLRLEKK